MSLFGDTRKTRLSRDVTRVAVTVSGERIGNVRKVTRKYYVT